MNTSIIIPVNEPIISPEAKKYVLDALETGWISSAGKYIQEFEEKFAHFLGVKHAIAVSSGTAALHVALLACGIGKRDEVIVPAFTMAATWMAVIYVGAKPVFVDCDPDTFNIDVKLIEKKISKRTKAIIPVHIYGYPVDMDPLIKIAKKHKLTIIEDAAEAHGAEYKERKCGSLGDINCFSFYANKIITTGEGGMIVTNNDSLAKESRKLMDLYHFPKRFIHSKLGFNYRMTNLQAAVGCGGLGHIQDYVEKKRRMAKTYMSLLQDVAGIKLPHEEKKCKCVYWMYAITVDEIKFGMSRDELRAELKLRGIDTRDFFYPPSDQPILKTYLGENDKFPNTILASKVGLYLPSGLALTQNQIQQVGFEIKALHLKALNYKSSVLEKKRFES